MVSLTSLVFLPLLTALLVLLIPAGYRFVIRGVALLGTLLTALLALVLFTHFDGAGPAIQFEQKFDWISVPGLSLALHFGADGINIGLLLAAALVGFAATAVSSTVTQQAKLFYLLLLVILSGALGAFASLDLFVFYFFNELALVPTFIMIGVWGFGEDRNYATFKITLYLTLGAMTALAGLILLYLQPGIGTLDILELKLRIAKNPLSPEAQALIFPFLLFGFGTLVGLWPFHSWAPQGYGCAPAATAMMHAGVLKKAGLLALLRVALPLFPQALEKWMPVLAALGLVNLLYCGWVAMRQKDLNLLLGNSSLAHMGFAFLGLASVNVIGLTGVVLVMVAHALLAGLSFALTGWLRSQAGTLEIAKLGGLLKTMPFFGTLLMVALLAGCGVPGFANFAGELGTLFGAWKSFPGYVVFAVWGGLVIGGVYMLRAIRNVLHGQPRAELARVLDVPPAQDMELEFSLPTDVGGSPLNWLARAVASVAVYVICLCTHGAVYRFWRTLPYTSLAVGLLYFGVFPQALTRRMTPAVAEIVKLAHAPAAPAKAAAPAPAVKPAK